MNSDSHDHQRPGDKEVPGQQIQARKGHVAGADHNGQEEVAEDGRSAGEHEHENHDHAVHREESVVGLGREQGRIKRQLLDPHEDAERHRDEEENHHGGEVEDADPLVIRGENPRQDSLAATRLQEAPVGNRVALG